MSNTYQRVIEHLQALPGIGPRSAERIAFELVRQSPEDTRALANSILTLIDTWKTCTKCGLMGTTNPCNICSNDKRNQAQVLVIERPDDALIIERSGFWRGRYHCLMGRISLLDGMTTGQLNTDSLFQAIKQGEIEEIILGLSPTLEGDGTADWLTQHIKQLAPNMMINQLARGLPAGAPITLATKAAIADAIHGRHPTPPKHS